MSRCEIIVRDNGSLRVSGDFVIKDMNGNEFDLGGRTSVSLCRCGHSKNKPFCDGTHKKVNFHAIQSAFALPAIILEKPPA